MRLRNSARPDVQRTAHAISLNLESKSVTLSPIPILYTVPNFTTAGSGRAMLNMIERLDRKQFSPTVCVLRKGGAFELELERLGIPSIEAPFAIPARPYLTLLWRAWRAARFFRPYRFAIWHSFHYLDDYTEPLIARLAGVRHWIYTKKNMSWGGRAWKVRSRLASAIAAQNSAMTDMFFPAFRERVRVIPPGVDHETFYPVPANGDRRSQWASGGELVVGNVAQLVPVKNHLHLIRALALCRQPLRLVLAGRFQDKDYVGRIKQLVSELHLEARVVLAGEVQEIQQFLNSIDIFAFCSHQEGCPVAVLEAMSCGLPCVVTNIAGIRDMHVAGETGLVVSAEDPREFAAALDRLAESPELRQRLGGAAITRIDERFSVEREVGQYGKLYTELLTNKAGYERC
jgi:glycosyltransferase involved in cell wall biosynthesis